MCLLSPNSFATLQNVLLIHVKHTNIQCMYLQMKHNTIQILHSTHSTSSYSISLATVNAKFKTSANNTIYKQIDHKPLYL